ncbi:hypothetical protein [Streptomyces sp. TN58]|uniref:hypothetical protein n=1 Tax=Streptomyces sp. TN58 TaxID=234612 RepID=UPI001F157E82|nr:hypothetical protein [Streptomyces sp. TN58]
MAYLEGCSIAALAREYRVSRGAIRTAVADLLPDRAAANARSPTTSAPPPSWSPPSAPRSTRE